MQNLNFALELSNGSASILTFFVIVFLIIYLTTALRRGWSWRTMFLIPTALALAVAFFVEKIGTMIIRSVVWVWRMVNGGKLPFTDIEMGLLITGSILTGIGLLMVLRILSRLRFGNWPWLTALGVTLSYVAIATMVHYL